MVRPEPTLSEMEITGRRSFASAHVECEDEHSTELTVLGSARMELVEEKG